MKLLLKKLLFFSLFTQASLLAVIPWDVAPNRQSAVAVVDTKTYTYNATTILDPNTFEGPLKFVDTATDTQWIYNYSNSLQGLGEWDWQVGDQQWTFNIATQQWAAQGGAQTWNHTDHYTWQHNRNGDKWVFRTSFSPPWEHNITDTANDDAVFTEGWEYNGSNQWTNRTRNLVWSFNYSTATWTHQSSLETWRVNFLEEYITCTAAGMPSNRWKIVHDNVWIEQATGIEWQYLTPETPYSPGFPTSGSWKNLTTLETWSYDSNIHVWTKDGGGGMPTYFPPLAPPLVALQVQDLSDVCASIVSSNIGNRTPPMGEYIWSEGANTLQVNVTSFKMTLGSYGITLGRGSSYGFGFSSDFEVSNGEKWSTPIYSGDNQGARYTNQSTYIDVADEVTHHAATDKFWRSENNASHVWQYHVKDDVWINTGSGQRISFDYMTRRWTTEGGSTWEYVYSGSAWVWRNLTAWQDWKYVEVPIGQGTYAHYWQNLSTSVNWQATSMGSTPVIVNQSTSVAYAYNPTSHLWHPCDAPSDPGLDLFPSHPTTMGGYIGFLQHLALTETTSTSIYGSDLGTLHRAAVNKSEFATLQNTFNTLISTYTGLARYNHLFPFATQILEFYYKNLWTYYDFENLYLTFNTDPRFEPGGATPFPVWLPTRGFMNTPGKAAFKLQSIPTIPVGDPVALSIGFSPEPTTDGSATYTLKLGNVTESISVPPYSVTTYRARLYKGEELLVNQQITPAPGFSSNLWLTYDNGEITVGKGDPLSSLFIANGVDVIFNYTIDDGDTPSSIQYCSLGRYDSSTALVLTAIPYTPDYFLAQLQTTDLNNRVQDYFTLAPLESIWDSCKTKLIALATTDSSYSAKAARAQEIIDAIEGTYTVTKPSTLITSVGENLLSNNSRPYYEYVNTSYESTISAMEQYLTYNGLTTNLEAALAPLLTADPSALSSNEKQTLIDNVRSAAGALILTMTANIANLTFATDELGNLEGNEDLTPFTNFFYEETAVLNDLSALLAIMDPFILNRFLQQIALYSNQNTPSQTTIQENDARRASERITVIDLLATRLAGGQSTLFSVLTAACIILCINNNFDTIRVQLDAYLTSNGFTNAHLFNSPPLTIAAAKNLLTTILDVMEPQIDLDGSVFYSSFNDAQQPLADSTRAAYIQTTITQTDPAFTATVTSGNVNYLNNTSVLTAPDEHVRNIVREITTPTNTEKTETYSRIYIKDANVALGNGNYTRDSNQSLSVFGSTEIAPDGNTYLTLNTDIVVTGENFLRPSANFGSDPDATVRCIPATPSALVGKNKIIFHSEVPRTITVTAGSTLDLTSFGQGLTVQGQQIIFSGNTTLLLEPNTRLRFPYTAADQLDNALEVIFQDNAQLIFQGLDNYDRPRFTDASSGADLIRSKILGVGKMSFYGNSCAKIMRSALVSVEADYTTSITDITVQLNDKSSWYIGDNNTTGGGFQVGNIVDGGSDNLGNPLNYPNTSDHVYYGETELPFIAHPTLINFTLTLNSGDALFNIGRQGFLGFSVGTINKDGNINGTIPNETTDPDTDDNQFYIWNAHSLFNVNNITLNLLNGTFSHRMVADGTDSNGSLLAFGPVRPRGNYKILVTKTKDDIIQCGGNVLFMRAGTVSVETGEAASQLIPIWSTVSPLVGGSSDSGKYSMLAPAPLFMLRNQPNVALPGALVYGRATVSLGTSIYQFTGPADEAYLALTFQNFSQNGRYVVAYTSNLQNAIAYVDTSGTIQAYPLNRRWVTNRRGLRVSPGTSISHGYLRASTMAPTPKKFTQ